MKSFGTINEKEIFKMKAIKKFDVSLIILLLILFIPPQKSSACDTWVALRNATKSGYVILAKNSDRPLFDCQPLMFYPHRNWPTGSEINLGRITIPQVKETFATMGSSPYWCWGYEEGINEYSVAIGNEGIFTKILIEDVAAYREGKGPQLGPTGMDLLRLGLERGRTAREALDVITNLIEKYGQFGSGSPTQDEKGAYHNSYIIADPKEAWILETTGTKWIAKRIEKGIASISNKISITTDWDLASEDLVGYAVEKGWWSKEKKKEFNFTEAYIDDALSSRRQSRRAQTRADCSRNLLQENEGSIDHRWMMRIARDRSSNPSIDLDQTASSCVAVLPHSKDELPVFWWCPSVPSNSCYIPFFIHGSGLPEIVSTAGAIGNSIIPPSKVEQDTFSPYSYWWLFKDLSDMVSANRAKRNPIVRAEFDALEKDFEAGLTDIVKQAAALRKSGKDEEAAKILDNYTADCLEKVLQGVEDLRAQFKIEMAKGADELKKYSGKYTANFATFQNVEFTVQIQNGKLSVDVPGQMVFELKEPDDEGLRFFMITNTAAVSFEQDENGIVSQMKMHQITQVQKQEGDDSVLNNAPDNLAPYIGNFSIPGANRDIIVMADQGRMMLRLPDGGTPKLKAPDEKGKWYLDDTDLFAVSFNKDSAGNVTSMNIHQTFLIPKGRSGALEIENTIEASGIQAAIEKFYDLTKNDESGYVLNESGINIVGYNLLKKQKVTEAIEIFKLNVERYPDSFNVHDSLGEAYMVHGDKELAIKHYRKSLELNPGNENARNKLKEMEARE